MTYESKDPEIKKVLDGMSKAISGKTVAEHFKDATCVTCGGAITEFRDALSIKEYKISSMCQKCQDSVFGR